MWLQLAGPRSAFDTVGRAGFYHALEQWSGYPELGLLMAVATCAMVAFACAARPPLVRVAAAVLALAFAGATVFLRSRSAVAAIPIVAAWLLLVAAVKWRSKAAAAVLVLGLLGATVVAVRGGGVTALVSRAADDGDARDGRFASRAGAPPARCSPTIRSSASASAGIARVPASAASAPTRRTPTTSCCTCSPSRA